MTIQPGQTVRHPDLAEALQGDQGTFLAQCAGVTFHVVAEYGHSITQQRQVLEPIPGAVVSNNQWTITKQTNQPIYLGASGQKETSQYQQQGREAQNR